MQRILISFVLFLSVGTECIAQSVFLRRNSEDYFLTERCDAMNGIADSLFSSCQPYCTKDAIPFLQRYVQKHHHELNRTTRHQLEALMGVHAEWAPDAETETRSRKPLLRSFYRYKSDFIHYSDQDFLFILNPIPGQEAANSDFLLEHGAAAKASRAEDLPFRLGKLLGSAKLVQMAEAARALGRPDAAATICREVARRVQR